MSPKPAGPGSRSFLSWSYVDSGFDDDRNIVAERCEDHDQTRFRVAVDVPAQDSRDIGLADASSGGISANQADDIDLPQFDSTMARIRLTRSNLIRVSVGSE